MRVPGMYLQLGIGETWMGGGVYAPDKNDIQTIRTVLLNHPQKFDEIINEKSFVQLCKGLESFKENQVEFLIKMHMEVKPIAYEWHNDAGQWFRSYGNENWEFAENGLMQRRFASINDLPIDESERRVGV